MSDGYKDRWEIDQRDMVVGGELGDHFLGFWKFFGEIEFSEKSNDYEFKKTGKIRIL